MMRKASVSVALLLVLLVSSSIFAGSVKGRIAPNKPTGSSSAIGLPAARGGVQGLRGGAVNPRAVEKFYYNPIIFFWDIIEGDAKYKIKALGNKGGLVKGTILVNECGGEDPAVCEVAAEFPPLPQTWEIKGKVFDANNDKIANLIFDPLQTVAPEKPLLISPENGATASAEGVDLVFGFAEGGIKYKVKVIDPAGGVTKAADTYDKVCNQEGECGFTYSAQDGTLASGTYSWNVKAKGAYGSAKSSTQTFVIP
jgi:hypothetical protein